MASKLSSSIMTENETATRTFLRFMFYLSYFINSLFSMRKLKIISFLIIHIGSKRNKLVSTHRFKFVGTVTNKTNFNTIALIKVNPNGVRLKMFRSENSIELNHQFIYYPFIYTCSALENDFASSLICSSLNMFRKVVTYNSYKNRTVLFSTGFPASTRVRFRRSQETTLALSSSSHSHHSSDITKSRALGLSCFPRHPDL